MVRRKLLSDSYLNKEFRRDSVSEYIVSRKGSLSDLVFATNRKLSRDAFLTGSTRNSRAPSLTNQPYTNQSRDSKQRSTSLSGTVGPVTPETLAREKANLECRNHGDGSSFLEKRFQKTNSLNETSRRQSRTSLLNAAKRRKCLRKLQVLQTFETALKTRQKRRFDPLIRFRRAARTVVLILKATASSRHASQQHEQLVSWTQLADEQSTARRTYDLFGISFDPSVFRAKREKVLSNEAKAILSLYPSDRTDEQVKLVVLSLNQTVDAFGEFPIRLQRSLASVGWYENFDAKRVIIRQGHVAENYYFILSGTAVVTLLETNRDTEEQCVRTVAILKTGNSFGELALMHGARRSATVTCKTNVELLAVSREDFIDIFMHIETDREPEHIRFLRSIDLLRGWPIELLPQDNPRICLFTFFRRGVLLCKDSNDTEWIYVIKSGTCRVLKDLLDTKPNIPGLDSIPYSFNKSYIKLPPIPQAKIPESQRLRRSTQLTNNPSRLGSRLLNTIQSNDTMILDHQHQLNEIFEKRHKVLARQRHSDTSATTRHSHVEPHPSVSKVFVQIQKLGPRDIFGLEQTVFGLIGQTTSCSLVSDGAECILINKKFFMKHLSDTLAKHLRRTIQPIPSEESLQQKLQDQANWNAFKTMTVNNFIVHRKQLHDHAQEVLHYISE
ncbi:cyclic nucleotide-binding domain-containing protein 2-like isoform X2 [Dreissena polymorpha]|uniref:cyclic nucleotide-binding domain-containing protein 2-like isoform X2 n=1 Tax=Dreissena polymorpha TaxID=45954 RepID=UPI0022653AA4|nr:cyclic nucleotide-binding domain-containing protein 2-like isoform X2 [Dreissena polymorpha]